MKYRGNISNMVSEPNPIFFFFFLRYDRNSNLNSHTHIFWEFRDRTHTLIEEWDFLKRRITTRPNAQPQIWSLKIDKH